ncbi:MAG: GxxExxY protein, partial [Saprospiraceae bacterium]|nr:GxxExxY protein [Saprospiraceae bacterium]
MEFLHQEITDKIIGAFYSVYNNLGYGFLEKVYERALLWELRSQGLSVIQQQQIKVFYKSQEVGLYFADLLVNDTVAVEIKAVDTLLDAHKRQIQNYLKATSLEVGLVLNFGPEPQIA